MKWLISFCLLVWIGALTVRAGPSENAIMAAMRLSDQASYSWVATVSDDARTYDISGKTMRGGFSRVKMPVINSVRRRLGRSVTDTQIDLIFRGNVACVLETETGWMRPDELPPPEELDADTDLVVSPTGLLTPRRTGPMVGGIMKGTVIRKSASAPGDREARGYSNLQLALSHPHEELGVIVGSHQEFRVEGDVATGTLTDLGAQLLLVRDGQSEITPLRATGTFKLWLRDGMVTKYQVKLNGTLSVDTGNGRRQIAVSQTTDTVLKDIGTTTFDVPEQARAKLGR